jgi:hypothetical protein
MKKYLLIAAFLFTLNNPIPCGGKTSSGQQTETQKPGQHMTTDQRGTEQSPIVVKVLPTARSQEEADRDAKEQDERSANDGAIVSVTQKLVYATIALAGIGLLQLIVFGMQARRLKETVIAAKVSSDAYMSGERAWVITSAPEKVPTLGFEPDPGERRDFGGCGTKNTFFCSLLNRGRTAAKLLEMSIQYRRGNPVPPIPNYGTATPFNILLVPGDSVGTTVTLNPEAILTKAEWLSVRERKSFLFVYGFILYEDVYGRRHETRFGYLHYIPYEGDTRREEFSKLDLPSAYNQAD